MGLAFCKQSHHFMQGQCLMHLSGKILWTIWLDMYTTSNMGPPLGIQFTQIEFYSFHNNETKIEIQMWMWPWKQINTTQDMTCTSHTYMTQKNFPLVFWGHNSICLSQFSDVVIQEEGDFFATWLPLPFVQIGIEITNSLYSLQHLSLSERMWSNQIIKKFHFRQKFAPQVVWVEALSPTSGSFN